MQKSTPRQTVVSMVLNEDLSTPEIIHRMKGILTPSTVKTYVKFAMKQAKERGLPLRPRVEFVDKPSTSFMDQRPITTTHHRVGIRLGNHRIMKEKLEPREFANKHHFANQQLLRSMEQGLHNFTLTELLQIAAILGTDLQSLLKSQAPDDH